jgi:predicted nucleic acid-binding Zn ribbon protein
MLYSSTDICVYLWMDFFVAEVCGWIFLWRKYEKKRVERHVMTFCLLCSPEYARGAAATGSIFLGDLPLRVALSFLFEVCVHVRVRVMQKEKRRKRNVALLSLSRRNTFAPACHLIRRSHVNTYGTDRIAWGVLDRAAAG